MSRSHYPFTLPTRLATDVELGVQASLRGPRDYPTEHLSMASWSTLIWWFLLVPAIGRGLGRPYAKVLAAWSRWTGFLLSAHNMASGLARVWPYHRRIPKYYLEVMRRR